MKLTHTSVLKRTWKNKCLPFVVMGLIFPLLGLLISVFSPVGLLIGAALSVLFFIPSFERGYACYLKAKRGEYVVYKQECTSVYTDIKKDDDGDWVGTQYSVFGDLGTYKHKGTDTQMPMIKQGDMYYLVVFRGSTEISLIFSANKYEIDTSEYSSADQHLYTPIK